jgi:ribonuclease PH
LDLRKLGSRTITIDADVLQADGSTRTAAITGGYVALHDAITWLYKQGLLDPAQGSPLQQQVAALSVGIVQGEVLLDLCYEEDSQAEVDLNVVMNEQGALIEIQGTAESGCFDRSQLLQMLDLAQAGIQKLLQAQREALDL